MFIFSVFTAAAYPLPSNHQYQELQQQQPPYPVGDDSSAGAWGSTPPYPLRVPISNTPEQLPYPQASSQFPTPYQPLYPMLSQGFLQSGLQSPMSRSVSMPVPTSWTAAVRRSYPAFSEASQDDSFSMLLGRHPLELSSPFKIGFSYFIYALSELKIKYSNNFPIVLMIKHIRVGIC